MSKPNNLPSPKYRFYATLLDSFAYYQRSQEDNAFQEFIDKLNRVPFRSEAAERGTAFNNLIDKAIQSQSVPEYDHETGYINQDGFDFAENIVSYFVENFAQANLQKYCEAILETPLGNVQLYGYADALLFDTVIDFKTTSDYTFPKYLHGYQHLVYPYCLSKMGFVGCYQFQYEVTDFVRTYSEKYVYNPERDIPRLQSLCMELIDFVEQHRNLISDTKIYAG